MADEPGFKINGRFYPWPTSRRLTDPALLEAVTGLTAEQWTERYIASFDSEEEDTLVSQGLIAQGISRSNPNWSRGRILEFMAGVDFDDVEVVGFKVEEPDARPPDGEATTETTGEPGIARPSGASKPGSNADSNESVTLLTSGT